MVFVPRNLTPVEGRIMNRIQAAVGIFGLIAVTVCFALACWRRELGGQPTSLPVWGRLAVIVSMVLAVGCLIAFYWAHALARVITRRRRGRTGRGVRP